MSINLQQIRSDRNSYFSPSMQCPPLDVDLISGFVDFEKWDDWDKLYGHIPKVKICKPAMKKEYIKSQESLPSYTKVMKNYEIF